MDDHDALRAHIRMRLAFWQAQDRRSITDGPDWLWRGQCRAPLRKADLSAATRELITRRQAAGMCPDALYSAPGPRHHRLPRWASLRSATYWAVAALVLALVAVICVRAADDRAGIGRLAGGGAGGCAVAALTLAALLLWAQRDPLRLNEVQLDEINASRRVLDWNPLAGKGPVSAGGAYLLEGVAVVTDLDQSSAWKLPGVDIARARFDAAEEIFQIARAAFCLDEHDVSSAQLAQRGLLEGYTATVVRGERRHLTEALLARLLVLHRCVSTLNELQQRAQHSATAGDETPDGAFFAAAAENELAAASLDELNTDLLAISEAYRGVGSPPGAVLRAGNQAP